MSGFAHQWMSGKDLLNQLLQENKNEVWFAGNKVGREEGRKEGMKEGESNKLKSIVFKQFIKGNSSKKVSELLDEDIGFIKSCHDEYISKGKEAIAKEYGININPMQNAIAR